MIQIIYNKPDISDEISMYESEIEQAVKFLGSMDKKYGAFYNTLQLARSKEQFITNLYEAIPLTDYQRILVA